MGPPVEVEPAGQPQRGEGDDEVGSSPRELKELVIALFRRGKVLSLTDPEGTTIQTGDMVVYVRDDRPEEL